MRGFLKPAVRPVPTETQTAFQAFSRGRRSKLARLAHTTLVKADQWARGEGVTADVATALEAALGARKKK
jgi:hypothetical protein